MLYEGALICSRLEPLCFRRDNSCIKFITKLKPSDVDYNSLACIVRREPNHLGHNYNLSQLSLFRFYIMKVITTQDYIHDPTFRHSGLVSSSGVIWCWNVDPYILSTGRQLPMRCKYSFGKSSLIQGMKTRIDMPGFQTTPLSITIIIGNDFGIII